MLPCFSVSNMIRLDTFFTTQPYHHTSPYYTTANQGKSSRTQALTLNQVGSNFTLPKGIYHRILLQPSFLIMVKALCGEHKLIIGYMKVTSIHSSRTTGGYTLELTFSEENLYLTANVFQGATLFDGLFRVKKGESYLVVGQLPVNTRVLNILDIH